MPDTIVIVGGRLYEALSYLPGDAAVRPDDFDFEDDQLIGSAGRLLGRLHCVLRGYVPPARAVWPGSPNVAGLSSALPKIAYLPDIEIAQRALPLFLRFISAPGADPTPRHVVHNDFAWYNCTRIGRRIEGVFDWDEASVASELRDVGYAVYAFAPIGPQRALDQTARRIQAFLTGYADGLGEPLGASHAQLLGMVAHRVALAGANLLVRAGDGDAGALRIFDHAAGYARWLEWYAGDGAAALGATAR